MKRQLGVALLCAVMVCGCARRIKIQKSPFQTAVETYYQELEKEGTQGQLDGAKTAVESAMAKSPASLELRALHLNILLQRAFLTPPAGDARREFIAEFRRLQMAPPGLTGPDWVKPRTYVAMGDYLLKLGVETRAKEDLASLHLAKAAFQSAGDFYVLANKLAAGTTEAMAQERTNATDGYVQSQRGVLDVLTNLDDTSETAHWSIKELMGQLRDLNLTRVTAVFDKGEMPTVGFAVGLLTPSGVEAQASHNQELFLRKSQDLTAWCAANKPMKSMSEAGLTDKQRADLVTGVGLLREAIRLREAQVSREFVKQQLFGAGDARASMANLLTMYKGLETACGVTR